MVIWKILFLLSTLAQAKILGPAFQAYLPSSVRSEIIAELEKITLTEDALQNQKSLHFTSGESYSHTGENVVNRIHYFPSTRFDIWFMRQGVAAQKKPIVEWTPLVLVVDKLASPKKAYYLELDPQSLTTGNKPEPKTFSAACYTCHASGPRVIRPQNSEWTKPLDKSALALLTNWNEIIRNYRVVETHKPKFSPSLPLPTIAFNTPLANEELQHHACKECHTATDGVRAPLLRQHKTTIYALLDHTYDSQGYFISAKTKSHALMPLESPKLSAADRACLTAWLESDSPYTGSAECTEKGEAKLAKSTSYLLDPLASHMEALAQSTLGKIVVKNFLLSGFLNCINIRDSQMTCNAEVQADLRFLQTGIQLRDTHLQEKYLHTATFPVSKLTFQKQKLVIGENSIQGDLALSGSAAKIKIQVDCAWVYTNYHCKVLDFTVDLEKFQIPVPKFLGAAVASTVELSGEIIFKPRPSVL